MRHLTPLLFIFLLLAWSLAPLSAQGEAAEATADCPVTLSISEEMELFASMRHFEGVDTAGYEAVNDYAQNVFLPLLKEAPGYRLYTTSNNLEGAYGAAINVFTSEEEMQAANALAAEHVSENLALLLPNPPAIYSGPVQFLLYANRCPEQEMDEDAADATEAAASGEAQPAAFLGYRIYAAPEEESEVDLATINALIRDQFAPIISEADGFILYLTFLFGDEEGMVSLNIFASREEMIAANAQAATFVAAELAEVDTGPPATYDGTVAVLDLSGLFAAAAREGMDEMDEEASEENGGG